MIETPSEIIYHIVGEELGKGSGVIDTTETNGQTGLDRAKANHLNWKMAFTVNKSINSKKLIEGIAKESKLFPFFKGDKLSFNSIQDSYDSADFEIKRDSVISIKFDRTKIDDVRTKVVLHYHYDYARKEYQKSTLNNIESDTAEEFFSTNGYQNSYLGIEGEQGDDPIELDYIRDGGTAEKLQRFLLSWYCNQHNLCFVRLPLSCLFLEVGDVLAFDREVNDNLQYGEGYSLYYRNNVGATVRNGQEILPYFLCTEVKKSLEYVDIKLIQLHSQDDEISNLAPIANAGADQVAYKNDTVTLDGTGSSDPDGDTLYYVWHSLNGIQLDNIYSPNPSFSVSIDTSTTYTFQLIVNDGEFDSNPDTVKVLINPGIWAVTRGFPEFFQLWWDYNSPYPSGTNGFYYFGETWLSTAAAAGHGIIISNESYSNWRWGVVGTAPQWFRLRRSIGGEFAENLSGGYNTNFGVDYSGFNELIVTLDEHFYNPNDEDSLYDREVTFYIEDEDTLTKKYFAYRQTPSYYPYEGGAGEGIQELKGISDLTAEEKPPDVS